MGGHRHGGRRRVAAGPEAIGARALKLPALYDGIARVKSRGRGQTDVLASDALGAAIGAHMRSKASSTSVGRLANGVTVDWKKSF
jgi:hypothetical protein